MTEFSEWIKEATHGASNRQIAEALGSTHPTIARRTTAADPLLALEVASAYHANPIDGLIAAGAIESRHILDHIKHHRIGIRDYSDTELAQEIVTRLQRFTAKKEREALEATEIPDK